MEKPMALVEAEMVEMIAQRYHVLPSAVLAEDASILRHLEILGLGGERRPEPARAQGFDLGLAAASMVMADGQ